MPAQASESDGSVESSATTSTEPQPLDPETEALAVKAEQEGPLRLIVEIDDPGNGEGVAAVALAAGGENERTFSNVPVVALKGAEDTIRALARDPRVLSIAEDVPQPPALASTLPVINADQTQALGWTGAGQTITVLDTGIDADHPFFANNNGGGGSRIIGQACFSDPNNSAGDGQFSLCPNGGQTDTSADVDGHAQCTAAVNNCDHGTHVTGIAAGDATGLAGAPGNGVAPDANIIAIQVFTRHNFAADCNPNPAPCLLTYQADQISALNALAATVPANPGVNFASANMSLGGGNNATACDADARKAAIDSLLALGIATVISSGNSSFLNAVGAPGCISTAVTVGNTADNDTVWPSSNRGPLLDLFAPGGNVISSIVDDAYGSKNGTSMSAPHVAGAFALLREAYPTRTVGNLLNDMTSTGVLINYDTTGDGIPDTTTPRLNLLAALQAPNQPPVLGVDSASVTVDEGQMALNTGTVSDPEGDPVTLAASTGTVVDNGDGTWSWSRQTADGPTDSQTVTIEATDDKDETTSVNFELTVDNVAPSVLTTPVVTIDEGNTVTVTASWSDPGWPDTHTADVDWGVPVGHEGVLVSGPTLAVTNPGGPGTPRQGTVTATYRYGDNDGGGGFTITVSVTDKDGGVGNDAVSLTVANLAPSIAIDKGNTVLLNGVPTVVAHAGDDVGFEAGATDAGSDDLTLFWDWDDGNTDSSTSLVNPPATDPLPSPTVQPRNITDPVTHAFVDACLYEADFVATDDDGAADADSIMIVIAGNADLARSSGYWAAEYRLKKRSDFTPEMLHCYLDIVNHVSAVFSEERSLASFDDATDVLRTNESRAIDEIFDAQLLAAWLNFANGAYDLDELVDTDGDDMVDTAFLDVMVAAETLRTDPARTKSDLEAMKDALERLNNP